MIEPIEFQTPTRTQNDTGEYEISWTRFALDFAAFKPVGGRESVIASKPTLQTGFIIDMRWRPGITSDMRIKRLRDNALFNISDIRDDGNGSRLVILCQIQ